jgi:hypothetical protein
MRLHEALKHDDGTRLLAEATLERLRMTDEATMVMSDDGGRPSGAVVACDRGLVVFTLAGTSRIQADVYAWRDVAPPQLTVTTEQRLETVLMALRVRLRHPAVDVGTSPFDLGTIESQIDSRGAAIAFWNTCAERAGGGRRPT